MSGFIFKVPALPEDTLLKRRKIGVAREKYKDGNGVAFRMESGNTSQLSLTDKSKIDDCFQLRSFRSLNSEENLAKPSTSKFLNDDNKVNIFQSSLTNLQNQNSYNMSFAKKSNCFLDTKMRPNDCSYSFNNINHEDMSHFMFTNRLSRCNPNLSSIGVNNPHPVLNQNFRNPSAKCNNIYGKNQCDYFDHPKYFNTDNIGHSSSVSLRKSVFSTGLLPEKVNVKNISVDKSKSKFSAKFNAYETLNGTGTTQKDSLGPLTSNQSILENQTIMKSVLQTSVFPMKEQIMNTLENFGQTLLRDAPEMKRSYFKMTKDVKSIFENNSIFMNQVLGTAEMFSTLNCTSDGIDFRPQNMLQYQCQGPSKRPCNILREIQSGRNEVHKVEFVKTFTVEEKKLRNSSKDIFDERFTFDSPPSKSVESKEVNLRNWYPIALGEGLAFSGLNDENVEFKTETVKKRINSRKVLLNNGYVCNLIGKGNPEKKFPSDIAKKLQNGIDAKWRILKETIAKFQKESQENMKSTSYVMSSAASHESSLHASRQKNTIHIVNVCKVNNDRETCGELDFISPKSSKTKARSKGNDSNESKRKRAGHVKKEKVFKNNDKTSCTIVKNDVSHKNEKTKVGHKDDHSSRILCVTRSGRIVKRPGDPWLGENCNSQNMENESKLNCITKTEVLPVPLEDKEEGGTCYLKRKRVISDKAAIGTKKNLSEQSNNEDIEKNRKISRGRERIKKSRDNSEPKSLNSTINPERKSCGNKGRKKITTGPQKEENTDSWVNDFDDGLINISELPNEELNADIKAMKLISMETPPLKILRSHMKILRSCTPVTQSPCWLLSQHTESGVKKFEKVRAQTFKKKIPKENYAKITRKSKTSIRNKDVEAVVNWIGEREVKSPTKYSKVIKYVIPKRSELEDEEEMENWEDEKQV